jgi:hypothetical protein
MAQPCCCFLFRAGGVAQNARQMQGLTDEMSLFG